MHLNAESTHNRGFLRKEVFSKYTPVDLNTIELVGASEAGQKLLPMAQQAVQWVQQVVK